MAETYKVLGQVAPASASAVSLYTVPSNTSSIISTLSICNRGTISSLFRVAVRPSGASLSNQHYIYYDTNIDANAGLSLTLGMTLAATDIITVYSSTNNLSFTAFGTEIT